ncbi:MAG: Gfo/Idh/MocA family oxidoreductase [candidate division KSB1 bacterium]|nr:Gfo/Idh/MocA family oxidoreductase [candidate division KSB1 bacterium]MDZ7304452.1 Gfo/Idh/MocA family oxidoreductase [candidate division KSB1 bacterium]MDZ7310945.1 Gfo/Idh/MocA family oxidoreductase [candidate division KSB1 bacterium]
MKSPLRFVVIGLGGMSKVHLEAVAWLEKQALAQLSGVVAIDFDRRRFPELVQSLNARQIPLYRSIEDFLQHAAQTADILTVPIGIHQHVPVSLAALRAGLHVYCEKPVAATIQEVDQLIAAQKTSGKLVGINFQNIYSASIQNLKARICDGRLGRLQSAALICSWPRSRNYYARNDWAGRLRKKGAWILDSPVNNAMGHYLHIMLYLASNSIADSATPMEITAELYRAAHIESYDTAALRVRCENGAKLYSYMTLAGAPAYGPVMELTCENGQVLWQNFNGKTAIHYHTGNKEQFDNGPPDWMYEGFRNFVRAIRGEERLLCPPEVCRSHTLCVNGAHESCPVIQNFPASEIIVVTDKEMPPSEATAVFDRVPGLNALLQKAFSERKLLSEIGVEWAIEGTSFNLKNYDQFPAAHGNFAKKNSTNWNAAETD